MRDQEDSDVPLWISDIAQYRAQSQKAPRSGMPEPFKSSPFRLAPSRWARFLAGLRSIQVSAGTVGFDLATVSQCDTSSRKRLAYQGGVECKLSELHFTRQRSRINGILAPGTLARARDCAGKRSRGCNIMHRTASPYNRTGNRVFVEHGIQTSRGLPTSLRTEATALGKARAKSSIL